MYSVQIFNLRWCVSMTTLLWPVEVGDEGRRALTLDQWAVEGLSILFCPINTQKKRGGGLRQRKINAARGGAKQRDDCHNVLRQKVTHVFFK